MYAVESACPNCSVEFGIKFKCEHCEGVFCDLCDTKQDFDPDRKDMIVRYFCPSCGGPSSRIAIRGEA